MNLRKGTLSSNEYSIKLSEEVFNDVDETLYWYKLHNEELAKEFYKNLIQAFYNILHNPKSYQKVHRDSRRCLVKKFPYSIIFNIDEVNLQIIIITVFHNSRNPKSWKERIN